MGRGRSFSPLSGARVGAHAHALMSQSVSGPSPARPTPRRRGCAWRTPSPRLRAEHPLPLSQTRPSPLRRRNALHAGFGVHALCLTRVSQIRKPCSGVLSILLGHGGLGTAEGCVLSLGAAAAGLCVLGLLLKGGGRWGRRGRQRGVCSGSSGPGDSAVRRWPGLLPQRWPMASRDSSGGEGLGAQ